MELFAIQGVTMLMVGMKTSCNIASVLLSSLVGTPMLQILVRLCWLVTMIYILKVRMSNRQFTCLYKYVILDGKVYVGTLESCPRLGDPKSGRGYVTQVTHIRAPKAVEGMSSPFILSPLWGPGKPRDGNCQGATFGTCGAPRRRRVDPLAPHLLLYAVIRASLPMWEYLEQRGLQVNSPRQTRGVKDHFSKRGEGGEEEAPTRGAKR